MGEEHRRKWVKLQKKIYYVYTYIYSCYGCDVFKYIIQIQDMTRYNLKKNGNLYY